MLQAEVSESYETKYTYTNSQALKVKAWLENNFPADPQFPEAIISSIYFDTHNLKHLEEKVNSDHFKSKFRIRWYEDPVTRKKSDVCFLEFKHKIGEVRHKRRIKTKNIYSDLPLESTQFFSAMNELRTYNGKILEHIFPSYIVSYTRKRFILPEAGMRICIDYNINVPKTNLRLVRRAPKEAYLHNCVFELKGPSAILPKELHYLEQIGATKSSFSKYERCFFELISPEG